MSAVPSRSFQILPLATGLVQPIRPGEDWAMKMKPSRCIDLNCSQRSMVVSFAAANTESKEQFWMGSEVMRHSSVGLMVTERIK